MKTKIATTFGLALVLAVGIFATMLALGMFSTSSVEAGDTNQIHTDTITVLHEPNTPGDAAKITVTFGVSGALNVGDNFTIEFEDDVQVPDTIANDAILMSASIVTNPGSANQVVNPADVTVEILKGTATDEPRITIQVPDMDQPTTSNGDQGIAANATVTVIFRQVAGIKNPTAAGSYDVKLTTTAETTKSGKGAVEQVIVRTGALNDTSDKIGKALTFTGKGFSGTGTATVWLDNGVGVGGVANDGIINGTEVVLAEGIAVSGNVFTADFTVDSNFAVGANPINAMDGTGANIGSSASGAKTANAAIFFTLTGRVLLNKSSVARGETIQVQLREYSVGLVTAIRFGGVNASLAGLTAAQLTVPASNALDINVTVPTTTPLGTQEVRVLGPETRTTKVDITGAPITVTPETAVPNASINLSGTGGTPSSVSGGLGPGGVHQILANSITLAGVTFNHAIINLDSGGSWNTSLTLPINATTLTPGTYEVRAVDSPGGRIFIGTVTIPPLVLTLDPSESGQSTSVIAKGTGFPATSTATGAQAFTVTLTYGFISRGNPIPDAGGNFDFGFTVPTNAAIPSANTVTATITGPLAVTKSISATAPSAWPLRH